MGAASNLDKIGAVDKQAVIHKWHLWICIDLSTGRIRDLALAPANLVDGLLDLMLLVVTRQGCGATHCAGLAVRVPPACLVPGLLASANQHSSCWQAGRSERCCLPSKRRWTQHRRLGLPALSRCSLFTKTSRYTCLIVVVNSTLFLWISAKNRIRTSTCIRYKPVNDFV